MKKIIRTLLVSLVAFICVYSVANAYEVKQGDTMWKIAQNAGISLVQLIRNNPQVSNPDLIFPGQQINTGGSLLGATQRPSGYQTTLSQSLSATASTTEDIKVASLTTKDNHTLTTADVGNYIILTISPGKGNEEKVLCVGGTATSTRKWLTCTRGFNYYNQTYGTATVYPHSPGETVIISDDDAYNATVYGYLSANNTWTGTNTSTGAWIFSNTNGMCLYNTNFCLRSNGTNIQWTENGWTDSYNFTSSSITQLTASTTAGIGVTDSKIYVNASSTKGLAFDANGALYNTTTTDELLADNNTWTGTNTFNGTTSFATTTFSVLPTAPTTTKPTFTQLLPAMWGSGYIAASNTYSGLISPGTSSSSTVKTLTLPSTYFMGVDDSLKIKCDLYSTTNIIWKLLLTDGTTTSTLYSTYHSMAGNVSGRNVLTAEVQNLGVNSSQYSKTIFERFPELVSLDAENTGYNYSSYSTSTYAQYTSSTLDTTKEMRVYLIGETAAAGGGMSSYYCNAYLNRAK